MGRKAKFDGITVKKGPGRKAKKQKDPIFPKALQGKRSLKYLKISFLTIFAHDIYCCK